MAGMLGSSGILAKNHRFFENVDFACRARCFSLSVSKEIVGKIRHQGFLATAINH